MKSEFTTVNILLTWSSKRKIGAESDDSLVSEVIDLFLVERLKDEVFTEDLLSTFMEVLVSWASLLSVDILLFWYIEDLSFLNAELFCFVDGSWL